MGPKGEPAPAVPRMKILVGGFWASGQVSRRRAPFTLDGFRGERRPQGARVLTSAQAPAACAIPSPAAEVGTRAVWPAGKPQRVR